jgi:anti-anti-sigma factor
LPNGRHLIVDLHDVDMIDSAGLGELVMVLMLAQASGCEVKLAAARPRIQALLEHTNLTAVLDVYPTLEAARLAFRSRVA